MYVLVEKGSGHPVGRGITVTSFRGDKTTLTGGMAPHKPSSTGKVWVEMGTSNVEMGPSAYGLKWEKDLSKHTPKQRPMHKWKSANYDDDDTHRNPW